MTHNNIDLGKTRITDRIRVSSAVIYNQAEFGDYWQVETWIFSDDPRQESRQIIHGTYSDYGDGAINSELHSRARRAHGHITANLQSKFGGSEA